MPNPIRTPNAVADALSAGRFLLTVEFASPVANRPLDEAIGPLLDLARQVRADPRVDALALTDRSRSDQDHDPIVLGHRVAEASGKMPLIHWAGKDRSLGDLDRDLRRGEGLGLGNFLLVTGDRLHHPPADRPVRYLDSVHALHAARQHSEALWLAAAICPFKYREEEIVSQYLKAGKKLRAGADVLITQIGWDVRKFEETRWFLGQRGYRAPLVAALLFLTPYRARRIRTLGLAGVTITDDLARRLEEDALAPDGGQAAAFRRLALQIVGARLMGYAGAHVCGLHTYPKIVRLLDDVETVARDCPTREQWDLAWREMLVASDGRAVEVAPPGGTYLASPTEAAIFPGAAALPAGGAGASRREIAANRSSAAGAAASAACRRPRTSARRPAPRAWPPDPAAAAATVSASSETGSASTIASTASRRPRACWPTWRSSTSRRCLMRRGEPAPGWGISRARARGARGFPRRCPRGDRERPPGGLTSNG